MYNNYGGINHEYKLCNRPPSGIAFTLAEVLIVLGIIGLIADMTIPTLISKTQEKVAVARLKKDYSTFESAFRLAVAEYGAPDNWDLGESGTTDSGGKMIDILGQFLNLTKNCHGNDGCYPDIYYKYVNGTNWANIEREEKNGTGLLVDGTNFHINVKSSDCKYIVGTSKALQNVCADFGVDINGFQPPNTIGRDYFLFWITKYGIIPNGSPDDKIFPFSNCNKTARSDSCTAWVLYNENMDYLHCDDLSWNGKKKCKH